MLERVFVSWQPPDAASYAYLLGLYLGDGCVAPHGRTARLVITLDGRYPYIVREAQRAVAATCPDLRVSVLPVRGSGAVVVQSYALRWLDPQWGAGRKHERPIALAPWQRATVATDPRPFLRGLIHSDGCRGSTASAAAWLAWTRSSGRSGELGATRCLTRLSQVTDQI